MFTPTTIKGHPLHPVLVALPIGLWIFSLICDIIGLASGSSIWLVVSFFNLGAGIICALIAAVPGFIDLFAMTDPNLKRVGLIHMGIMLFTVAVFVVDFWLRLRTHVGLIPFYLSIIGVLTLLIGGWLGAKLVHVFGVTVEERHAP
ncbi:MAG TPA: DUF2231 domain-containing protein [Verrucomicrobiae bacterium]|nr:DUF2231 domain-containing protein [Verrucomicrobiae bacterium]